MGNTLNMRSASITAVVHFRVGNQLWILGNVQVKGTQIRFNIDRYPVQLQIKNEQALLLETLGMKPELEQSTKVIKAPMPGKVLSIEVEEGNQVQEGETILVLEAMKWKMKSSHQFRARIKTIQVELGQNIDKQTLLVELE